MSKLLKRMSGREVLMTLVITVLVALQVFFDLKLPDYMTEITETVEKNGALSDIWATGGKMLLCAFASLASAACVAWLASHIAAGFSMRLRLDIFRKVQSFSLGEIGRFSTPSLITRSTNDVTQIQTFLVLGLQVMIKAPIMAVWAIFKIVGKGAEWTTATGVAVAIMLAVVITVSTLVIPRFRRIQWLTDGLNRVTRENLTGLRVVRAYNAENFQQAKFDKVNDDLTGKLLFTSRLTSLISPAMSLVMNGLTLAVYWIGASLINGAAMTDKLTLFSNMVVFSQYGIMVVMSFMMLTMIFILLPRASVSARRINEILDTICSVVGGPGAEPKPENRGEVAFKNVSFKYPGAEDYVIRNVSFSVKRGEVIAFIGSTGSGKSTIVNLIPRFYDVTEGEVLVDGVDVRRYTQKQLRDRLGYIPQRSVLFSGTVASNVAYGDNGRTCDAEALEDAVRRAVRVSQAADFVENMPDAYDSDISQGGTNVSGGQKQRLCIARAVCRDPEIFIFDDSFSALDFKTDKNLRAALRKELHDATFVIVAQRIGTIRDADRIVVLENGEVAGMGTHDELMRTCGVYREIALSQLSEEELADE